MKDRIEINLTINANADQVWQMLTNPDLVKQYMFGSTIHSDWTEGSSVVYTLPIEGKDVIIVNGLIEEIKKPTRLHHTLFPTGADMEDIRENYLDIIYSIDEQDGVSELTIEQFGFSSVANGEQRYNESVSGWDQLLAKMKEIAESV